MSTKGIAVAVAVASISASTASAQLMAGAASRVVTPSGSAYMAGLKSPRLSEGVHDDLYARALALRSGDTTVLLVGVDVIGLLRHRVEAIKEALSQSGVPVDGLIVCASHQHSGPDTIGIWGPSPFETGVDADYMGFLSDRIVEAAQEAYSRLQPATAHVGVEKIAPEIADNARIPGYFDDEVRILQLRDEDGKTISTLVNFTAHPETLWSDSHLLTADYPGHVYAMVEREFGGTAVFINGALGGMVTVASRAHTFEEAERIGTGVGEAALAAARKAVPVDGSSLQRRRSVFDVIVENERLRLVMEAGVIPAPVKDARIQTEVNLVRLGDVVFASVPGELLPKPGFAIRDAAREELGARVVFLMGLGNDELGYILAEEDTGLDLYRYEVSMSVHRGLGTTVVDTLRALMRELSR
ncbi:hypothetical protein FJZ36_14850 [Candidatus Poribacteria bacterium]|nr:hypothetical protein [Candidatus Poribacteria bacterium]